jgi:hypothetical protein
MIADLKADSERWENERRATDSRGQPSNGIYFRDSVGIVRKSNTLIVEYRASITHQSRQYYGPTEAAPGAPLTSQGVYDNSSAYGQQTHPQQATAYAQPPQGYAVQGNYYVIGADMAVDQRDSAARVPVTRSTLGAPRRAVEHPAPTPTYQQHDSQAMYYPSQLEAAVSSAQYVRQPTDLYYGRGAYNH